MIFFNVFNIFVQHINLGYIIKICFLIRKQINILKVFVILICRIRRVVIAI